MKTHGSFQGIQGDMGYDFLFLDLLPVNFFLLL
jgi:hypothetical protein